MDHWTHRVVPNWSPGQPCRARHRTPTSPLSRQASFTRIRHNYRAERASAVQHRGHRVVPKTVRSTTGVSLAKRHPARLGRRLKRHLPSMHSAANCLDLSRVTSVHGPGSNPVTASGREARSLPSDQEVGVLGRMPSAPCPSPSPTARGRPVHRTLVPRAGPQTNVRSPLHCWREDTCVIADGHPRCTPKGRRRVKRPVRHGQSRREISRPAA